MRLTLRTLLAYLDDVLDPVDSHELGQKIEESEFASGLVHRIRGVTRKLRLGAPKLGGKGMGLDANTVAEYLDSTLPQDRVPDFEKVCLESDVHLAEVASCHQILTLVLGEPADVDPALREHIRALAAHVEDTVPHEDDGPSRAREAEQPTPPPVDSREQRESPAPAAPEVAVAPRLRESGRSSFRLLPIAGTLLVAFLLTLVALIAMGPLDENHPVVGSLFAPQTPNKPVANAATGPGSGAAGSPNAQPATGTETEPEKPRSASTPSGGPSSSPPVPTKGTESPNPDRVALPEPPTDDSTEPPASADGRPLAGGDSRQQPRTSPTAPPSKQRSAGTPASDATAATPAPGSATAAGAEPESVPVPPKMADDAPADSAVSVPDSGAAKSDRPTKPAATDKERSADVGRFTSDQQVLARLDPKTGFWLRLPALSPLSAGQRLVALPTYRPQVLLAPGIQVIVVGPAELRLLEVDAEGVPGVRLEKGRLLLLTDGKSGSDVNLQVGERTGRLSFPDSESTAAVELRHMRAPGSDPEKEHAPHMLAVFASGGRLRWQDRGDTESVTIDPDHAATVVAQKAPSLSAADPPDWIGSRSVRLIDRDASMELEPLLAPARPLSTSLEEQASNRLVEVRTLAVRSLALLDQYDTFVDALNEKELRSYWQDLFRSLQAAVSASPESAKKIRLTLERLRGEEGSALYRMLWGYSPTQLESGSAQELVKNLEHRSMDVRVLAFENLRQITGRTNSFRPEREAQQQKRAILTWNKALRAGEITYTRAASKPAKPDGDAGPAAAPGGEK